MLPAGGRAARRIPLRRGAPAGGTGTPLPATAAAAGFISGRRPRTCARPRPRRAPAPRPAAPPPAADAGARGAHKSGELTCPPRRDGGAGAALGLPPRNTLSAAPPTAGEGARRNPWEGEGIGLQPPRLGRGGMTAGSCTASPASAPGEGQGSAFRAGGSTPSRKAAFPPAWRNQTALAPSRQPLGVSGGGSHSAATTINPLRASGGVRGSAVAGLSTASPTVPTQGDSSPTVPRCRHSNPDTCPVPRQHQQPYFFPITKTTATRPGRRPCGDNPSITPA